MAWHFSEAFHHGRWLERAVDSARDSLLGWLHAGSAAQTRSHAHQEVIIKASKDAQLLLLQVQELDSAVLQLMHRRRTLPELGELQRHAVQSDELDDAAVAAETAVSDLEADQARAEADLDPVRERLSRNRKRIADGTVADPKALSSMIEEVEHLKKRIGDLEDAELEVMEALEEATATRDRRRGEAAELAERERTLTARRDEQLAVIDAEMAERRSAREGLVPQLPADLLAAYTRLAASHSGVGAAELVQRRCTGCRLEVNAAELRAFAAAPEDEVLRCEECGRILIRTDRSGL